METKRTCANCDRELGVGLDATKVDEGVIGTRGFVPLDKTMFFCCEECIKDYYDLSDLPSVPRRIP